MQITIREFLLLATTAAILCWNISLQRRLERSWEINRVSLCNEKSYVEVFFVSRGDSMYFHRNFFQQDHPDLMKALKLVEADQRK